MKNITDYFTSPIKVRKSTEIEATSKLFDEPHIQNINSENGEMDKKESESKTAGQKKTKKRKKRKPTDPSVKDVTELLSNNLKLISPGGSDTYALTSIENNQGSNIEASVCNNVAPLKNLSFIQSKKVNDEFPQDTPADSDSPKTDSKKDAFQFLMNNRNNIIGQNSDGKVIKEPSPTAEKDEEKLCFRKNLFRNWADRKGALKRKREEEEIEMCISKKMVERTNRLKQLLNGRKKEKRNEIQPSKMKKKRVMKISSSESENSSDLPKYQNKLLINEDAQDSVLKSSDKKQRENLLNFFEISKDEKKIKIYDEEPQGNHREVLKIKLSIKSRGSQKHVPRHKSNRRNSTDSAKAEELIHEDTQVKKKKRKTKSIKEKVKLNDSMEDFCSEQPNGDARAKMNNVNIQKELASERVLRPNTKHLNYSELLEETPKCLKTKVTKTKKSSKSTGEHVDEIELSSEEECAKKRPLKVAPVFLKATPKPKVDQEVVEARKQFLMSGIPASLKKSLKKQKGLVDREFEIFPRISHIQQKCNSTFWDLTRPALDFLEISPLQETTRKMDCQNLIIEKAPYEVNLHKPLEKINKFNSMINKIKVVNPHYPVYKVFKQLCEKRGTKFSEAITKTKKSLKRRSKQKSTDCATPEINLNDYEVWTEKYKPRCSGEILGNHAGVSALKRWLEMWMNYREEIRKKKTSSNSESEFESTDCDSRDSAKLLGNTMIVGGPCGSGKTSAVYAIAKELNFEVIEINASSKRTGKKLIQELQEATQSHQVRKNESTMLTQFVKSTDGLDDRSSKKNKKPVHTEQPDPKDTKKMCILLVEDVDLVFEQDDGFLSSLNQLITTSKRPIILTTTDSTLAHVQKIIDQFQYISFLPLSIDVLGVWLQIVCLVEGLLVDKNDVGTLLEYNQGDVRKTLLEIQYWCQSGGQLESNYEYPIRTLMDSIENDDVRVSDDDLKVTLDEDSVTENHFIHKQCVCSFEIFRENKQFIIPYYLKVGLLWWNIPNLLSSDKEFQKELMKHDHSPKPVKLESALNIYHSLIFTDCLFKTVNYHCDIEPVVKSWSTDLRDSLELTERKEDNWCFMDLVHDVTHTLVNGCVEDYHKVDSPSCWFSMTMPHAAERSWRTKQHACEEFLKEPISLSNTLDRRAIALDFLPSLRQMARLEAKRFSANNKRKNRFRHYFKNLNMDFKESLCKSSCNILTLND